VLQILISALAVARQFSHIGLFISLGRFPVMIHPDDRAGTNLTSCSMSFLAKMRLAALGTGIAASLPHTTHYTQSGSFGTYPNILRYGKSAFGRPSRIGRFGR